MKQEDLSLFFKEYNPKYLYLLVLISMFIFVYPINAATYNFYFSNNGSGSTCSENKPCATVSDAQKKVDMAGSSDTVNLYFKRGNTWTANTAAKSKKPCYGIIVDSNDPIVNIDAYGTGSKPVFDGLVSNFQSVPSHNATTGPLLWNRIFEFRKANCSVKNVEIKRCYGNGISLNGDGETGFVLKNCAIHHFGGCAINVDRGAINVTVEYCEVYKGQELNRFRKRSGWGGGIQLKRENGRKPAGNVVRYNLVYDIYGEGINAANAIIEYNLLGDTSSVGICNVPHNWDFEKNIVRYNLIMMSDWSRSVYDNMAGSGPVGLRVFDEQEGGSNLNCDIQIYGNIIINRSYGIWLFNKIKSPFGSVKVYNNTIIDSHIMNIFVNNPDQFKSVKIYNNASILYESTNGKHAIDYGNFLPYAGWIIDNNAFWTTGGSPVVDSSWKKNHIVIDPKLTGSGWTSSSGPLYFYNISVSDIYPPSDSGLVGTGKNLESFFVKSLLTSGTDFSKLPSTAVFHVKSTANTIGAITRGTNPVGNQIPPPPPTGIRFVN